MVWGRAVAWILVTFVKPACATSEAMAVLRPVTPVPLATLIGCSALS